LIMSSNKQIAKKLKLAAKAKVRPSPRWADIKKFSLKRARTRRVRVNTKRWRRDKLKV
jgi:ribosomal protein L39E